MKGLIMIYGEVISEPIISVDKGKEIITFTVSDQESIPTYYVCKCYQKQMLPQIKKGSIVNISGVFQTRQKYNHKTQKIENYHLIITTSVAILK